MFSTFLKVVGGAILVAILGSVASVGAADTSQIITEAMNGDHRSEAYKARNQYRHPRETLLFFGLKPDMAVIEITPGGGWYSEILAPVLRDNGVYYAASYRITENSPAYFRRMDVNYRAKLESRQDVYGKVRLVHFDRRSPEFVPPGSADIVLTFRNVHNWAKAGTTQQMFRAFYEALKPGGVLGVIDHRARPGTTFSEQIASGYMDQDYVIGLARDAGFQLGAQSQINANPKDMADHPGGVWNLPPSLRNVAPDDAERMRGIGESDRMTLKFIKR